MSRISRSPGPAPSMARAMCWTTSSPAIRRTTSFSAGAGADNLTGGAGNDTFVYTDISDSLVGSADLITDFTSTSGAGAADDKLDLSGIDASTGTDGDQAFGWAQLTPPAHSIWIG